MKTGKITARSMQGRQALALFGTAFLILLIAFVLVQLSGTGSQAPRDAGRIGGPFRLTDDQGRPVSERSFPGKYLLVYFGYVQCPDICPATLSTLAASLSRLGVKADAVQPLFVTVDPAHDTQAVLHRFVAAFSPRLVGLSGTPAQLRDIADSYGVLRTQHEGPGGAVQLDHSAVLYLMSPEGRFVAPIPADATETVMTQVIARYVS